MKKQELIHLHGLLAEVSNHCEETDGIAVDLDADYDLAGFDFRWTGTPNGTLEFFSADIEDPSIADDTDWHDMSETVSSPGGSASGSRHRLTNVAHRWLMLKYAPASGTGTLTAKATLKGR